MAIILFTDFGTADLYVGQMKAVLQHDAPNQPVIDLLHDAPAFGIKASAHLLAALATSMPAGSVFVAIVDPGVGGSRLPVVLQADGCWYVGPDNGLLSVVAGRADHARAFRIAWTPPHLSISFHGRDLFAPVAARIASNLLPPDWIEPMDALQEQLDAGDLAQIIYLDHYGNAYTGIRAADVSPEARLVVNGHTLPHARVFSEAAQGQAFWYANSQALVEISVNQGNAAARLGLKVGDQVAWAL